MSLSGLSGAPNADAMSEALPIKSLIYISRAAPDLDADDLDMIHHSAVNLNALDGITGLLVYNGTHFLQIVEGADAAVDDLLQRLFRDPRHADLEIVDETMAAAASFPDWSMNLVKVSAGRFDAREDLQSHLPDSVTGAVRAKLTDALGTICS